MSRALRSAGAFVMGAVSAAAGLIGVAVAILAALALVISVGFALMREATKPEVGGLSR